MDDTGKPPPDYYADLGLSRFANTQQIRKAWRDLAKATHPDRKENESGNAAAFHKIQEAYEVLSDWERRARYDEIYFDIQHAWTVYGQDQEAQRRQAERRAAAEQAKKARKAAEAESRRKRVEEEEEKRRKKLRDDKERQAEERSRQVAARAWEAGQAKAREKLQREGKADSRRDHTPKKKAEPNAAERERQRFMARAEHIRERAAASVRKGQEFKWDGRATFTPTPPPRCAHPGFQWPKKKGRVPCAFCGVVRVKWAFSCPDCAVSSCPECLRKICRENQ